jgi:hypothetical protein
MYIIKIIFANEIKNNAMKFFINNLYASLKTKFLLFLINNAMKFFFFYLFSIFSHLVHLIQL